MLRSSFSVLLLLAIGAMGPARGQHTPAERPQATWQDVAALGITPYRQLTVEDFPVNDTSHPNSGFYIKTAIQPRYHFLLKPHTTGWVYAYIDQWLIFSGLDKKETSRKSKFKTMKAELPYAQALLDISEIHARGLAALQPGELPSGRGANFEEARSDMETKLKTFIDQKYGQSQIEMEAFAKATEKGAKKAKVRELAAEIRKRLDATLATTVPFPQPTAAVSAPPAVVATPSPAPAPSASAR